MAEHWTKAELAQLAAAAGIESRPSWTKAALVTALTAAGVTDLGPDDLRREGRALWGQVAAWLHDQDVELDPHECALVAEMCRTADRLATIRAALRDLDPTTSAWTRLASEERQRGLAFARLVSAVGFATGLADEDGKGDSARSRRAIDAARARWNKGPRPAPPGQGRLGIV